MNRLAVILAVVAYMMALHWVYVNDIVPIFSYLGYVYYQPSATTMLAIWLTALAPTVVLPIQLSRPSQVVSWILFMIVYIPSSLMPTYSKTLEGYKVYEFGSILLTAFVILLAVSRLPPLAISIPRLSVRQFNSVLVLFSLLAYAYIVSSFGLSNNIPDFTNVADVRLEYRDQVAAVGPLVSYFLLWQGNVVNNLVIARGFVDRRLLLIGIGLLGQTMLFSITGYKSMFFSTLMVGAIALISGERRRRFGLYFAMGMTALVAFAGILDRTLKTFVYTSIFVRRVTVALGLITGYYYDFFSVNPKVMLSHSIFSPFYEYPYQTGYNYVLGAYYSGRSEVSMNGNLWADGYANFGVVGMFISSILLGLCLWVADSVASHGNARMLAIVFGVMSFSLANSAFQTVLISHGLGFLLSLILLMPVAWTKAAEFKASSDSFGRPSYHASGVQRGLPSAAAYSGHGDHSWN